MKKIVYYILILICIPIAHTFGQTEQIRSGTSHGAGWKSAGAYTNFGVVGQSAVATEANGGNYTGSVGFLFSPPEPNEPPIAYGTPAELYYELGDIYSLEAFDPEGENLLYEIVDQAENGMVTFPDLFEANEVMFTPNATGLLPDVLYHDSFTFKVTEDTEDGLSSEVATIEFSFKVKDQPHAITTFTKTAASFELVWDDNFINPDYNIQMEYYDVDAGGFVTAASVTVGANDYDLVDDNTLDYSWTVNETSHPYLFIGDLVFINVEITSEGGYSDSEGYVLDNTDPTEVKVLASEDGLFFAFGSSQTVPENGEVTLQLSAVELGEFDVSEASIELLSSPDIGTITQPSLVKETEHLLTWEITYTATGDVGGLDEVDFSVFHPDRDVSELSTATVEVIDVNDPPRLGDIVDQQIDEDTFLEMALDASDPDSEYIITATADDEQVTIEIENDVITVTPDANYSGTVDVEVLMTEDGDVPADNLAVTQSFELNIIAKNDTPVLASIGNESANEDETVEVSLSATDEDDNVLIFDYLASVDNPSIADVEIIGSQLSVVPVANAFGSVEVTVTADDKSGSENSESEPVVFTVDFAAVNDQPEIIQELNDQVLVENSPGYSIDLSAYFKDIETASVDLDYDVSGNTDVLISFTGAVMNVTTTADFFGTETITITVSDGSLDVSMEVAFIVNELGANIIVANAIDDYMLDEDFDTFEIDVSNVFQDSNDVNAVFDYELSGNNYVITSVDDANQRVTISSAENVTENETLRLVGITGNQASFVEFDLIISSVNDAPELGGLEDKSIFEDADLTNLLLDVSDVDNDVAQLNVTAVSQNQSFLSDEDIEVNLVDGFFYLSATPGANINGSTEITVSVSDGNSSVDDSFVFTILAVNDIPTVDDTDLADGTEDVAYSADLSAFFTDDDGDALTYEIDNLPGWLALSGAVISGTPENDDTGDVSLQVVVSDGNGGSVQKNYDFSISPENDFPEFVEVAEQTIQEDGELKDLLIEVSDVDNDFSELTFRAYATDKTYVPDENITLSTVGGFLTLSAKPAANVNGSISIYVIASDESLNAEEYFTLNIEKVNDAPMVVTTELPDATEDTHYSQPVTDYFTDIDVDDQITISVSDNPDWLSITNGILSGTPTNADVGDVEIMLIATDLAGDSVSETYAFSIASVNDAPIFTGIDSQSVNEDEVLTLLTIEVSDEDHTFENLTFTAVSSDEDILKSSDIVLSTENGILSLSATPLANQAGSVEITITADDGTITTNEVFTLDISNVNDAPVISNATPDVKTDQNSAYTYSIPSDVFSDVDVDDNLDIEIVEYPDWLTLDNGVLTGTPGYAEIGTYTITSKATDLAGEEVTDSFELEVEFVVYDIPFSASNAAGCSGESIIVEAEGAIDYNWYDKDNNLLQTGGATLDITAEIDGQVIIEAKDDQDRVNPDILTYELVVNASPEAPIVTEEGEKLSIPEVSGLTYQWYLDDVAISGSAATAATYSPEESGEYYALVTNAAGCTATSNIVEFSKVLGLSFLDNTLKMYPVPVKSDLILQSELDLSKYNFDITDMNGKLLPVKSRRALNSVVFDVSGLANGVYIMRVHKAGELAIRRFIKE